MNAFPSYSGEEEREEMRPAVTLEMVCGLRKVIVLIQTLTVPLLLLQIYGALVGPNGHFFSSY